MDIRQKANKVIRQENCRKGYEKRMKRFILAAFMILTGLVLFACGKREDKQQSTKSPAGTDTSVEQNVSGGAAATERPVISSDEAFREAEELVKSMTLEEKVGQMFLVSLPKPDTSQKKSKRKGKKQNKKQEKKQDKKQLRATKQMKEMIAKYHVGGIYLTEKNIEDQKQTKRLVSDLQNSVSGGALYVAVEEEGGGSHSLSSRVAELKATGHMMPDEMGRNMTEQQVYQTGEKIAKELVDWGINLNLAPVADIAAENNPDYAERCYGTEPDSADVMVSSIVSGMSDNGLAVTLKYFPGLGNVPGDYTEEILLNQDSLMKLRSDNFSVYSAGIEAGADCVMVGSMSVSKITVKKIPAFLSEEIVTSLLREELGFGGVIMTSPLNDNVITKNYTPGYAAVEAVKAGCDLIVLPGNLKESYEALLGEVRAGKLDEKVINTSVRRILQNKIQRGILVLNNNN